MSAVYQALAERWPDSEWIQDVSRQAEHCLQQHSHGDLPRWRAALADLPPVSCRAELDLPTPVLGSEATDPEELRETLLVLHPWRKGPLRLGGVTVDSEWRSDWKWARIAPHVDLCGRRVLDIGCGNGYFGLRMLGAGARLVVGVDPNWRISYCRWRLKTCRRVGRNSTRCFRWASCTIVATPRLTWPDSGRCRDRAGPWYWKPWFCPLDRRTICSFHRAGMRVCETCGRYPAPSGSRVG